MLRKYEKYKTLCFNLIITELKLRYKNSVLGFFWVLLEPLLIALTLLIVFTQLFVNNLANFPAYLLVGFTAWFFFVNGTNKLRVIFEKQSIVKNVKIPNELIVFSTATASLINSVFEFIVLIIILYFIKVEFTWNMVYLPLILILQFIFIYGVLLLLSSLYVYIKDLDKIWFILQQAWFFLTPIVYPQSLIAKNTSILLTINPMLHFINAYRNVLVYGDRIDSNALIILFFISVTSLILGWKIFKRLQTRFAEVV